MRRAHALSMGFGLVPLFVAALAACDSSPTALESGVIDEELLDGRGTSSHTEIGRFLGPEHACTATLVANNVAITAASCVDWATNEQAGNYGSFVISKGSTILGTYKVIRYRSFGDGSTSRDNIALLQLGAKVPTTQATPARLSPEKPSSGERITTYGFGCTDRHTLAGDGGKRYLRFLYGMATYDLCGQDVGAPSYRASATTSLTGMIFRLSVRATSTGKDVFADVALHHGALRSAIASWGGAAPPAPACGAFAGRSVWTCVTGTKDRARCVDGKLERVTCGNECQVRPGSADVCAAVSSEGTCDADQDLSMWTCLDDGRTMRACADDQQYVSRCQRACAPGPSDGDDVCLAPPPKKVGLFAGSGAGATYVNGVVSALANDPRFVVTKFYGATNFDQFDLVVFPGGIGATEWGALGASGQANLRSYVDRGGGYVGICAGFYMALPGAAGLLSADIVLPWARGAGSVGVRVASANGVIEDAGSYTFHYENGPVLWPGSGAFQVLATFTGNIGGGATMVGKPAVVSATFGHGRVVGFSPHPELSGLGNLLKESLLWAARR